MHRLVYLPALLWLVALSCGPKPPPPRVFPPPPADHLKIARAEAKRHAGVETLTELSQATEPEVRRRALRGLGRIGSEEAVAALRANEAGLSEDHVVALAIAGDQQSAAAIAQLCREATTIETKIAALWALGRIGANTELAVIGEALDHEDPAMRAEAAVTLGLYGRRQIELSEPLRQRLVELARDPDRDVRYGVAYALAREHGNAGTHLLARLLASGLLVGDDDPEIRALALFGSARRRIWSDAQQAERLRDPDWRVRVEAVRALSGSDTPPHLRAALAEWMVETAPTLNGDGPQPHALLEGLARLADYFSSPELHAAFDRVYAAITPGRDPSLGAVHCAAAAARVRAGAPLEDLVKCGGAPEGWPLHLRRRLLASVMKDGTTAVLEERVALMESLGADADPRVRAAAIGAGLVSEDTEVRELASTLALSVLKNETSLVVIGTVVEVIAAEGIALSDELEAALLSRARQHQEGEAELRLTLIEALRASDVREGRDVLEAARGDANLTVRTAASEALAFMFPEEEHPSPNLAPPAEPPVAIDQALGREIRWHLSTSRGEVVIELWPETAPWNVATLVTLAEKGSYNGTPWHRVVPNFVVQGGDPTGSGWGGPGFATPGEPSRRPFVRGAVGIADAGKDTGGSQFFIMHARAPHLEGRYTLVGRVVEGMEIVDGLIEGDRIVRSWIVYP